MANIISSLLMFVLALLAIFGVLCSITGEEDKGNQILINCLSALFLYMLVIQLLNVGLPHDSIFEVGIPLINNIEKYGSVRGYLSQNPRMFALDFVELVSLTVVINWVSNNISVSGSGLTGKIIFRIIVILLGIIVYGFVMEYIRDNVILKWCVYCVECIITGGSILYTPTMIFVLVTGISENSWITEHFMSEFPKTSFAKAVSVAITSSIMFLVFLFILESQYGSVCNIMQEAMEIGVSFGGVAIMLMGIFFLLKSVRRK